MGPEQFSEQFLSGTEVGVAIAFFLIYLFFVLSVVIVVYVLTSLSLYSMAKRRQISKPWLAWLPVGNMWIMGSLSDHYQRVAKQQIKHKRVALLVLMLIMLAVYAVFWVVWVGVVKELIALDINAAVVPDALLINMVLMLLITLVILGICIAMLVIEYVALYDIYASCDPRNKTLYLVLSIFVAPAMPIILFVCRKRDDGLPVLQPAIEETVATAE